MTMTGTPSSSNDLVGLHDVRMVEPRGEARLVEEHLAKLRIAHEVALERLEHDQLVEAARAARDRQIDVRRAPLAQLREPAVLARLLVFEFDVLGELIDVGGPSCRASAHVAAISRLSLLPFYRSRKTVDPCLTFIPHLGRLLGDVRCWCIVAHSDAERDATETDRWRSSPSSTRGHTT